MNVSEGNRNIGWTAYCIHVSIAILIFLFFHFFFFCPPFLHYLHYRFIFMFNHWLLTVVVAIVVHNGQRKIAVNNTSCITNKQKKKKLVKKNIPVIAAHLTLIFLVYIFICNYVAFSFLLISSYLYVNLFFFYSNIYDN